MSESDSKIPFPIPKAIIELATEYPIVKPLKITNEIAPYFPKIDRHKNIRNIKNWSLFKIEFFNKIKYDIFPFQFLLLYYLNMI